MLGTSNHIANTVDPTHSEPSVRYLTFKPEHSVSIVCMTFHMHVEEDNVKSSLAS